MKSRNLLMVLVCLVFATAICTADAWALTFKHASFDQNQEDLFAPKTAIPKQIAKVRVTGTPYPRYIYKVKPKRIVKCRPEAEYDPALQDPYRLGSQCLLPMARPKGWEMNAAAFFARMKGTVRYVRGNIGYGYQYGIYGQDVDLNSDLGVPDHGVVPEFSATYRFKPNWSLRYSIMPMSMENTHNPSRSFVFGSNQFNTFQNSKVKWERLVQHAGIVYDPVKTYRSRISIFTDYVRVDDKISFINLGCCGDTWDESMNMAMAGLEFERCLRTGRINNTLSMVCKAGVGFLDEAFASEVMTGLKYSIPLNNGRRGYITGAYRFATYKKGYSDVKSLDVAMEGASIQMGFVF
ncbi:MAG: hypothetical protein RDU20_02985 [Desulfomonilaceae bacterium]|nr:hypothetical protein [Desulfomonilaceae bacterium]